LDTHVVLWWLSDPGELAAEATQLIANGGNVVLLSAAVVWEIEIKQALGKLDVPKGFERLLAAQLFTELPVRIDHAHAVRRLPSIHRDPFDRILVARAMSEEATVVTRDRVFSAYRVPTVRA
jgi:PIN domain nuclease of toxin-antitoxin system